MVVELRFRDWTSSGEQQLPQTMGENTAEPYPQGVGREETPTATSSVPHAALCPILTETPRGSI